MRVLTIAASDCGGGAGIQADIKTITALGAFAASAITAITVQNTVSLTAMHRLPASLVEAQARAVLSDIGADAIKTGVLGSASIVERMARLARDFSAIPLVVDPVLRASGGHRFADRRSVLALRTALLPLATLLTPNLPEAEILAEVCIESADDVPRAAESLLRQGARAVLIKDGHGVGERVRDRLFTAGGETVFEGERLETRHTHGTGCTLASACAVFLAQGAAVTDAVRRAILYTSKAICSAPGFGSGRGPLDHAWPVREQ